MAGIYLAEKKYIMFKDLRVTGTQQITVGTLGRFLNERENEEHKIFLSIPLGILDRDIFSRDKLVIPVSFSKIPDQILGKWLMSPCSFSVRRLFFQLPVKSTRVLETISSEANYSFRDEGHSPLINLRFIASNFPQSFQTNYPSYSTGNGGLCHIVHFILRMLGINSNSDIALSEGVRFDLTEGILDNFVISPEMISPERPLTCQYNNFIFDDLYLINAKVLYTVERKNKIYGTISFWLTVGYDAGARYNIIPTNAEDLREFVKTTSKAELFYEAYRHIYPPETTFNDLFELQGPNIYREVGVFKNVTPQSLKERFDNSAMIRFHIRREEEVVDPLFRCMRAKEYKDWWNRIGRDYALIENATAGAERMVARDELRIKKEQRKEEKEILKLWDVLKPRPWGPWGTHRQEKLKILKRLFLTFLFLGFLVLYLTKIKNKKAKKQEKRKKRKITKSRKLRRRKNV